MVQTGPLHPVVLETGGRRAVEGHLLQPNRATDVKRKLSKTDGSVFQFSPKVPIKD